MEEKQQPKRRGRKPKGGKLIQNALVNNNSKDCLNSNTIENKISVIVHLKHSISQLKMEENEFVYDPTIEPIKPYSDIICDLKYKELDISENIYNDTNNNSNEELQTDSVNSSIEDKLKNMNIRLDNMKLSNLKSNCFWCTYNFDNASVHIPKKCTNTDIYVYGNFCSPECAASYLLNENIDESCKFERLHLLNYIYGDIYNYKESIKPALNPYYTLSKYFGTLSIDEFRNSKSVKKKYSCIDKPMTLINPEFNEDCQQFT